MNQTKLGSTAMRTRLEFRSDKFSAYPGEEEKVNPNLWGQRLAEFLQARLTEKGVATGEIYPEDWGWVVELRHEAFKMWLGCGHQNGPPDNYLVFIEPSKPVVRRSLLGFKKTDATSEIERIAEILNDIFESDPEVRDTRWWDESEAP